MADESEARDGARVRFPPLAAALLVVVGGILIHKLVLPWPFGLARSIRLAAAALLGLAGLGMEAAAIGIFRRTGQDPLPWKETPSIIATGVYRLSRNPMYFGMVLVQGACALWLDNAWILALAPVTLGILFLIAVRPEEAYLERKFGRAYLDYKRSVRRWL